MIDAVRQRLEARVPELAGRTDGAAEFAKLVQLKRLPPHGVAAFVLPLGLIGGASDAVTGFFSQAFTRSVGVVVFLQTVDRTGERALARLEPFLDSITAALCGWAPSDEVGVFELARGGLVNVGEGRLAYQIDFRINDQLRITP